MKYKNTNFIYDFETLGTNANNCVVLCCAKCEFSFDEEPSYEKFMKRSTVIFFDVDEQVNKYSYQIEKDTCDWWKNEVNEKTRNLVFSSKDLKKSVSDFPDFIGKENFDALYFSRGQGFDFDILCRLLKDQNCNDSEYVPFYNTRDTRSFIDGMSIGLDLKNSFIPFGYAGIPETKKDIDLHHPKVDIVIDILRLLYLHQSILSE